ncbi:hypothetical protein [Intrasporangium sp. YIM S08009]|uniref:hypothetical protein n=1 Tax=Intrasporangium zincisolvens TaxID=3080018 RepID=UPI002B0604BE|nr:hypothetical protein [Intrasporangium sp. YIM S08009]
MTAPTLTAPDPRDSAAPGRARPRRRARAVIVLVVLALLAIGIAIGTRAAVRAADDVRSGTRAVSAQDFAAATGVNLSLLGVTAQGGMIEFRYQVVDPDKASLLLHQDDRRPILVAEDTGATLVMLSRPHNHKADLKLGGTYFFMMANTQNAVRDGTKVTVIVGDVRLEHVVARA